MAEAERKAEQANIPNREAVDEGREQAPLQTSA